MAGLPCDAAEAMAAYDPGLKGGEVSYRQTIKAQYVDPVDGKTRFVELTELGSRFTGQPGGRVFVRTHKTLAGKTNSGQWTENAARGSRGA